MKVEQIMRGEARTVSPGSNLAASVRPISSSRKR